MRSSRSLMDRTGLAALHREIVRCRACPRLVDWREEVARTKVARFRDVEYWGKPVPGFGDTHARILLVGLAPGAHGANRTGRMFTGDRSGDFLFAAMHRAGLASQATSRCRGDGLVLRDAYIIAAIRCAPPANLPRPEEISCCAAFFDAEVDCLPNVRVVIALGAIAWRACLEHFRRVGAMDGNHKRPPFAHGAVCAIPKHREGAGADANGRLTLLGSFHVSQQNTQTGKLTAAMFDAVLASAKQHGEG
jgi:uracil-DNA glycosylase family 4